MNDRPSEDRRPEPQLGPSRDQLLVQRYVDGELRPAESQSLEQRLLQEPSLVRELERIVQARGPFRSSAEEPVPLGADFADRVFSHLLYPAEPKEACAVSEEAGALAASTSGEHESFRLERSLRVWTLVAASLLLLLGAFALFSGGERRPGTMMADDGPAQRSRVLRELDARARALDARAGEALAPQGLAPQGR
ncbi:MAG: hypothetical protein CSA62_01845 [Planctomycetota bacterium]|nr:MAG: hypothetical protein CSA62_01845 [Planctomycetota bacterium]